MQLRRLNADHAGLHSSPPADYLIPQQIEDLTSLDVYLVGPAGTPFESGVFKLNVRIPREYPLEPPKAHFRTKIWHPNVEEHTGEVCVDMLKTAWRKEYTLKDVLDAVRCLLIQPNPSSALNSDAGLLCEDDNRAYFMHAKLMTKVHAPCPAHIRHIVAEIRQRAGDSEYYQHNRRSESPIELYADEDDGVTPVRPLSPYAEQSDYEGDTDVEMSDAEDVGKENSRNASNVPARPRRILAPVSPLRKRSLDEALDEYEEGRSVLAEPSSSSSSSHSPLKRKSPKLDGKRESGVNSNGRIRSADEEVERRKRKELEKRRAAAAASRKPAVRKGLKRL